MNAVSACQLCSYRQVLMFFLLNRAAPLADIQIQIVPCLHDDVLHLFGTFVFCRSCLRWFHRPIKSTVAPMCSASPLHHQSAQRIPLLRITFCSLLVKSRPYVWLVATISKLSMVLYCTVFPQLHAKITSQNLEGNARKREHGILVVIILALPRKPPELPPSHDSSDCLLRIL